jgi:uncharacterized SAM-binding protein YcdF (DUF218 family)
MLFFLSKLLPAIFFPLGFACLAGLSAAILAFAGKRKSAAAASLAGVAVLYLASLGPVSQALLRSLEDRYPQATTYPPSPAIVILGGAGVPRMPPRLHSETNAWGDRLGYGAMLFRRGLAPRIMVTGGLIPWGPGTPRSEAATGAEVLRDYYGIDPASVLLADESRNTREDAACVRRRFEALGLPKEIILVTSAAHMPRSVALFRKEGFLVHPAPGDFHASARSSIAPVQLLPDEADLAETWFALHEYLGYYAYRFLGWI